MPEIFTPLRMLMTIRRRELVARLMRAESELLKAQWWKEVAEHATSELRKVTGGAAVILREREYQILEGFDAAHDDRHQDGELVSAAIAYMQAHPTPKRPPWYWPWEDSAWKPSRDRIHDLVKAGALIAAEIDRLRRARDA